MLSDYCTNRSGMSTAAVETSHTAYQYLEFINMLLLAVLRGAMGKGNKQGILRIVVAFVFKGAEDFHSQLSRTMLGSLRPIISQYTSARPDRR
jgi:hypothetical protein